MEWISVKDELPEIESLVLIYEKSREVPISARYRGRDRWDEMCNCDCGDGWGMGFHQEEVTHWMPLPRPPGE